MTKYILSIMLLFLSSSVFAQTPEALNYQGVARDGNGAPLTNQAIGLQFSIHESSATGTVVYEETFTVTTSDLGLFALQLGTGTVATGDFSAIDWGA
ncbi:MAG: hypothetical protein NWR72_00770, partial [Bacteroidia bacterium]|nr:hypothetical protein [Bacteroidia bacterium]